jgi:glycosyltransferase involved in cell wall biosynthesis
MKIAIVVQRYGLEICGGAELHARCLAERLSEYAEVEIITSTAYDFFSWKPYYKSGIDNINGITVRRFDVTFERKLFFYRVLSNLSLGVLNRNWLENFKKYQSEPIPRTYVVKELLGKIFFNHLDLSWFEKQWLKYSGPYSRQMLNYLEKSYDDFDIFLFYTHYFTSSSLGLPLVKDKSILMPLAHDDLSIYVNIFRELFKKPAGFIFNTPEEKELIDRVFDISDRPSIINAIGINIPDLIDEKEILKQYPQLIDNDYIIFAGRSGPWKGTHELIDYLEKYKIKTGKELLLVLVGKNDMKYPDTKAIISTGFISEEAKYALMKNAKLLVNPSLYESLSLILLESWLMETPVMVTARCNVTRGQVERSGGGLIYNDFESFSKNLDFILENPEKASEMGKLGRKYTEINYSWDTVLNNYLVFFKEFLEGKKKV